MRSKRWGRSLSRWAVGVAIAGAAGATLVALPAGTASARPAPKPCDGAACVPLTRSGSEGAECSSRRVFPFGIDGSGNGLICLSVFGATGKRTWAPVNLVGVRKFGALCSASEDGAAAQAPDGIPMRCRDEIWSPYVIGIGSA